MSSYPLSRPAVRGSIKLAVIVLVVVAVATFKPVNQWLLAMADLLASLDVDQLRAYILGFGFWAPLVSTLLMVFQAVLAPLPAFMITLTNAALFGWWQGALLSWSGAMLGAVLCFYLARWLGRDVVIKLTNRFALEQVDTFFARHGQNTVLIARLLPFISFDLVSYAAGLTAMKPRNFLLATGIGQLPATLVYSYVGGMLTGGSRLLMSALLCLFALAVLIFILKSIYFSDRRPLPASRCPQKRKRFSFFGQREAGGGQRPNAG